MFAALALELLSIFSYQGIWVRRVPNSLNLPPLVSLRRKPTRESQLTRFDLKLERLFEIVRKDHEILPTGMSR